MSADLLRVVLKTVTSQAFGYPGLSAAHQMLEPWPRGLYWPLTPSLLPLPVSKVQETGGVSLEREWQQWFLLEGVCEVDAGRTVQKACVRLMVGAHVVLASCKHAAGD